MVKHFEDCTCKECGVVDGPVLPEVDLRDYQCGPDIYAHCTGVGYVDDGWKVSYVADAGFEQIPGRRFQLQGGCPLDAWVEDRERQEKQWGKLDAKDSPF